MITETMGPPGAPGRTAVVAVAATSTARFRRVLPVLGAGEIRSVLVIGIAKLRALEACAAPTTGLVRFEDMEAEAIRRAGCAASAAAASLSIDVVSRHCACRGWRDARLRRAVSAHHCQSLFVHSSDVPAWRRRGIRRWLAEVGVSLVVVDTESTGGEGT